MASEHNIKVSVIVTIHNAEDYLRECLESVQNQTLPDIEILCIDGGSTDASPCILREYARKDDRIRIIDDANTSYGHKVNEGIKQAQGEYISVLESDDMYLPDMLERLYAVAQRYHPDYVNADYLEFWDVDGKRYDMQVKMYPEQDYNHLLESGKHLADMRQILRYWTGIFRREFLLEKGIWMNESPGASFQDMSFRFLISALADTCYHMDMPVYLYRTDNPGSSVYDPKKAVVIADEYIFLKSELKKRAIENTDVWRHFYVWKYNDFYGNLVRFNGDARRALYDRCREELNVDRHALGKYRCAQYSNAISDLLEKSETDVLGDIEERFQHYMRLSQHREKLYKKVKNRKIVIFGCGARGKGVLKFLQAVKGQIYGFTDNNESLWNLSVEGLMVFPPEDMVRDCPDALYVVANKCHSDDITVQLGMLGVSEEQIYVFDL